jgi:CDP-6-deoxy-D-xylo-4-hexulose-3-dehydrase
VIKLINDTINNEDIDRLVAWLQSYPRLTKGPLTVELENRWSKWLGAEHSIFCNSGSSAILLMLFALIEAGYINRKSKVVVPALAWATDLAPVIQLGLEPLLCDVNMDNLSVDLNCLEDLFQKNNPQVLILVSVLGLVPEMKEITSLCEKYNVILLEDACESLGSKFGNKKLGTFGRMSSFSTYFGHHISTIEGGFVSTDDKKLSDILKSIRSHGWDRDMDEEDQIKIRKKWNITDFNSLYTFYYSGFNLRSTDLQAFIGLGQLDKLNNICERRNENFKLYQKLINNDYWKIKDNDKTFVSNFAYPIIHPNRNHIVSALLGQNIEVRPLICGSMGQQPFYVKKYGKFELTNASEVEKNGFYVPNHPDLTEDNIKMITNIVNENITVESIK